MADYYKKNYIEKTRLLIASYLHDIGKLTISNTILDKPKSLINKEFKTIKKPILII